MRRNQESKTKIYQWQPCRILSRGEHVVFIEHDSSGQTKNGPGLREDSAQSLAQTVWAGHATYLGLSVPEDQSDVRREIHGWFRGKTSYWRRSGLNHCITDNVFLEVSTYEYCQSPYGDVSCEYFSTLMPLSLLDIIMCCNLSGAVDIYGMIATFVSY